MAALALGLSVWQGTLSRDASAAHAMVAIAVAGACIVALAGGRHRQARTTVEWVHTRAAWRTMSVARRLSMVIWLVLICGVVSWDLASFVEQSPTFPTLSSFIGHLTRYEAGRGALFAVWLAVGAFLAIGYRSNTETR